MGTRGSPKWRRGLDQRTAVIFREQGSAESRAGSTGVAVCAFRRSKLKTVNGERTAESYSPFFKYSPGRSISMNRWVRAAGTNPTFL